MRIHIHYKITGEPWGGSNSFFKAFKSYLQENKNSQVSVVERISGNYDILLMGSNYCGPGKKINYKTIKRISEKSYKNRLGKLFWGQPYDCKIIHRVDGLRSKYTGMDSFCESDMEQYRLLLLSDWIIFQSRFSLNCFKDIGYTGSNYSIIHNGVNQEIFNYKNRSWRHGKTRMKILSNSWSRNRKKGFDIISLASQLENVELIFLGNWCSDVDPGNVKIIPPLKQEELVRHYKECDVFLFPSQNEACSNVLLEALSCGLPVLYHNSGGTPELAEKYGFALPEVISKETLNESLEKIKMDHQRLVNNIKQDIRNFSINYTAEQYLKVFERVANSAS